MKAIEAEKLVCPYMSNFVTTEDGGSELLEQNCILEKCMFWQTTISGKKEIDRYQIPYETYPTEAGNKHRQLLADGYVELPRSEGREMYAKYKESYEGYCNIKLQKVN